MATPQEPILTSARRRLASAAARLQRALAADVPEEMPRREEIVEGPSHVEMTVLPRTAWDPSLLNSAKSRADQGDMELAADLWESMLADDRVAAAMEQRLQGLEGIALTFDGDDEATLEAINDDFWEMSTPGTRASVRGWALGIGIAPLRVREWRENASGRMCPVFESWHPRWLRFRQHEQEWYIQTQEGEVRLSAEPGQWFLYCPGSEPRGRPWVNGLWYSTATWWLQKSYAMTDLANFGQSHATPKWILKAVDGLNMKPSVKTEALSWLTRIIARSSMFVPHGFDLTQEETNSTAWQAYPETVKLANRALASRILGQHLTTDEAGGAGAVMDDALRQDLVEADADVESDFWHSGPFVYWGRLNFPDVPLKALPYPRRAVERPVDLRSMSETQRNAADALGRLVDIGAASSIDVEAFLANYFPVREPGDGPGGDHPSPLSERVLAEGEVTDFPQKGDDLKVSLRNSRFKVFDPAYADRLKEDWPEIWGAGGNDTPGTEHSGDDQWRRLRPQVGRAPETATEEAAVRRREAWAARHAGNKRLAGVVALVKWLVVGDLGEAGMKRVIEAEKDRIREARMSEKQVRAEVRRHALDAVGYGDAVVEQLQERTEEAMTDMAGEVLRELAAAKSYPEARKRLQDMFPKLDPSRLRSLMTGAILMSSAAGMASVGFEGEEK